MPRSSNQPKGSAIESADPAERLSQRLVSAIINLLLAGLIAFCAVTLLGPVSTPTVYRITFPLSVVLLSTLRFLVRRGHVRLVATVLCVAGWLIVATDLQAHGSHTVALGGFLLMVVIGGLTLGSVAAFSLAGAAVALLALVMLGGGAWPAFAEPSPWTRWVHYSTQLVCASVLVAWWAQSMKQLLTHLRESEARHAQLLEDAPDATISVDREGIITFCNAAAEQMLGYPRSSFVGRRWDELPQLPKDPQQLALARGGVARALTGTTTPADELEFVHRDGRTVTVEVKSVPLRRNGQIAGAISTVRDVSARKQVERERQLLEKQLVSAQRMEAVGRFAGGIAHDFNNVLTIIFNAAEIMRISAPDGPPAGVDDILEAARRGASLARQLLAFSRNQPSEARTIDVHAAVVALRPMLARLVGKDVVLEVDLDERGRPMVRIGPGQLDQVLMNLTINARDAMPKGGTIRLSVAVQNDATGHGRAELTFADTGHGMDAATVAQAFEPFFSTKGDRGTGLGLAIAKRIVEQASGTIQCESEPGRGTTFRITFPLVAPSVLAETPNSSDAAPRAKRRVVLVDDNPRLRFVVARALQSAGVAVDSIATPLDLNDVRAHLQGACALITDVVMPGMTGPDLVDELRHRGCDTPVIFVSGYADHALIARIRSTPGASLLAKPFTPADILARLEEIDAAQRPALAAPCS